MKLKITITGKLDLTPEDAKVLRRASPELVAQTLIASGKDVKTAVQREKEEE